MTLTFHRTCVMFDEKTCKCAVRGRYIRFLSECATTTLAHRIKGAQHDKTGKDDAVPSGGAGTRELH